MLILSLIKAFMVTTSERQSSNNCEHITQWKIEMSILLILNILSISSFKYDDNDDLLFDKIKDYLIRKVVACTTFSQNLAYKDLWIQ